jgi:transcription antitermination protein NusB
MASRRKSRERALQVLFLVDQRKIQPEEAIESYAYTLHSEDDDFERMARDRFMEELVQGALAQREQLDAHITRASEHWRLDRMPAVDRNILRLATYELLNENLPAAVVIDEALELARRFSGDESVGFVNGVLDSIKAVLSKKPAASLANAKSAENAVEDVVGRGSSADPVQGS